MYDGTIVVLYARPGLDGDVYYTRKCNYGLNLQVCLSFLGCIRSVFIIMVWYVVLDWECTLNVSHCRLLVWSYQLCA